MTAGTPASAPSTPQHAPDADASALLRQVVTDVAELKAELGQIVRPLVDALKRDRYFDELQAQLRRAAKLSEAWRDWPLISGVHDAVLNLRTTRDADPHLLEHLESLLFGAGVTEYGLVGDAIDPEEAEITASTGTGSHFIVTATRRPGLRIGSVPLRKPIVEIARQGEPSA